MHSWIFALAFRYLFPKHHKGTFFTWISILGIAAGVTLLCVILSIMNGFDQTIENRLVQINGPIKILSSNIIKNYKALETEIQKIPHVKAITPFIQGVALIQYRNQIAFPKCLGIAPETVNQVLPLKSFIQKGKIEDLHEGIFLTPSLMQELGIQIGEVINLYSPLALEAIKQDEMLLPQELEISGIFKTDWAEIDRNTLLCSLEYLQDIYGLKEDQIHGFSLDVDQNHITEVCKILNSQLPITIRAYAWNELNKDFLYILRLEKMMCFFVLLFVIGVAAFSISSGLMSSIVRKQREIALLRTWGAIKRHILSLFCYQACFLSICGIFLGFIISWFVLTFRNQIIQLLTGWFLPKNALWDFYAVEQLPVAYCKSDFIYIALFAFFITLFAALLPAFRASTIPITKGLRHE